MTSLLPVSPPSPSSSPRQSLLQLSLSQRVPLVKIDTVIAARGENADTIYSHADKGALRWVFNLATNPGGDIRDLRFWSREIKAFGLAKGKEANFVAAHEAIQKLPQEQVIAEILGPRTQFHAGEVCLLLAIRRPTLMLLRDQLLTAGRQFYQRHSLERFLMRRRQ